MGWSTLQARSRRVWELAKRQHGVIARYQLLEAGFSRRSVEHRIAIGRLHPVARGVYAIGRPELTRYGRWMAAVLSCGAEAALSHESAAALWEIRPNRSGPIHISVPASVARQSPGVIIHRRLWSPSDLARHHAIQVTTPISTLIDLATRLDADELEAAVNEADKRDLVDPERLREALDGVTRRPGVGVLRGLLDRRTFTLTDSELERRFLRIARDAGMSKPEAGCRVNGFKVDFYWRDLGLVVETDGLRYHRTPAQQARDRIRDQAHVSAGLTPLRFTRAQVRFEPEYVRETLVAVASRLRAAGRG